jgi:hypothetical protein
VSTSIAVAALVTTDGEAEVRVTLASGRTGSSLTAWMSSQQARELAAKLVALAGQAEDAAREGAAR